MDSYIVPLVLNDIWPFYGLCQSVQLRYTTAKLCSPTKDIVGSRLYR